MAPKSKPKAKAGAKPMPKAAEATPEFMELFCEFTIVFTAHVMSGYREGDDDKTPQRLLWHMVWSAACQGMGVEKFKTLLKARDIEYKDRKEKMKEKILDVDKECGGKLKKSEKMLKSYFQYLEEVDDLKEFYQELLDTACEDSDVEKSGKFKDGRPKPQWLAWQEYINEVCGENDEIHEIYYGAYAYTMNDFDISYFFLIYWRVVFWLIDKNQDGKVSKEEFEFATGLKKPQAAAIFMMLDEDHNGTLDVNEIVAGSTKQCDCAVM